MTLNHRNLEEDVDQWTGSGRRRIVIITGTERTSSTITMDYQDITDRTDPLPTVITPTRETAEQIE